MWLDFARRLRGRLTALLAPVPRAASVVADVIKGVAAIPARCVGLLPAMRYPDVAPGEIIVIGGYGYGNVGDEAQLGANLDRWRTCPAELPGFSYFRRAQPTPPNTMDAGRRWRRGSSSSTPTRHLTITGSGPRFRFCFWRKLVRMEINVRLMRAGLPPWLATGSEARLLFRLQAATALHVSGGGFLTGPTRSRLWDSCLVMRICRLLGTPYFLSGQTIGVFENKADRWLARMALHKALGVSLRDPEDSREELVALGLRPEQLVASYDDALFCGKADEKSVAGALRRSGVDPSSRYFAVSYHRWNVDEATSDRAEHRFAGLLDKLGRDDPSCQILFLPMHESDVEAQKATIARMCSPSGHSGLRLFLQSDARRVGSSAAAAVIPASSTDFRHGRADSLRRRQLSPLLRTQKLRSHEKSRARAVLPE